MNWLSKRPRRSARAIIIEDRKILLFLRKRYSKISGEWIEYYSIPGGGIDPGETAEQAVVRELQEEMGVEIAIDRQIAHRIGRKYEHFIYHAQIVSGVPHLMPDSEEALHMHENNQFIVRWVDVEELTKENLRYYSDYLELIRQVADGHIPYDVVRITVS